MITHSMQITGRCPLECADAYEATFRTRRLIPVEVIIAAVKVYTIAPIFQEQLTQQLADCLQCEVELVGTHSNVRSTVVSLPRAA